MITSLALYLGDGDTAATLAADNPAFPDALEKLREWQQRGLGLYLLGSEPPEAQKERLQKSPEGDLTPWFNDCFGMPADTVSERATFRVIANAIGASALEILLLSDHGQALDTAQLAGFATRWLLPDSEPDPEAWHVCVRDFGGVDWLLGG